MKLTTGKYFGENVTQSNISGLILTEKTHDINQSLPEHFHENPYFCLALSGGWKEVAEGKEDRCSINDLVYHPAGEVHSTLFSNKQVTKTFNIEITEEWMNKIDPLYIDALSKRKYTNIKKGDDPVKHIYTEFLLRDTYTSLAIEGALFLKISRMARATINPDIKDNSWIEDMKITIERTFQNPLTLLTLSQIVHMHPSQLSRDFHKGAGYTISGYYKSCRLNYACALVKDTKLSLVEVAIEAGYFDQSHMCQDFKKALHMTPLHYLKKYR